MTYLHLSPVSAQNLVTVSFLVLHQARKYLIDEHILQQCQKNLKRTFWTVTVVNLIEHTAYFAICRNYCDLF